jgi:uncharacterized protein YegP (UPF0339 family)
MSKALRGLVLIVAVAIVGAASLNSSTAQDKKDKDKGKDAKVTAVFELYKDKQDEFRFRLKDDEGTTLAISPHGYKARPDVQKAIDAIKANAAKAKVDDQTKAK